MSLFLVSAAGRLVRAEAGNGWPSGTEDIYKIYAESFQEVDHLGRILEEAQTIVGDALAGPFRQLAAPHFSKGSPRTRS